MVLVLKPLNKRYGLVGILTIVTILTYLMAVLFDEFGNENIGQNIQLVGIYRCVSEFFIGVCTWLVYRNYETKSFHLGALLFYGGIGFFLILSFTEIKNHYYVPILMATILLGSISQNNIFTSIFSSHFFVWLGDISYSIYLTHYLIRDFFKLLFLDTANASLYWIASYVLVVIFISHFLYKYFEMPSKQFILKRTLTKAKLL
jgi:peptidoglycan/LPS O-acetylase OafA/YrhL